MSRFNVCDQLANAVKPEALIAESATGKGPSPKLWSSCPWFALQHGAKEGFVFYDDFMGPIDVTTGDGWTLTQVDTKGSISGDATAQGGVLIVTSATGDSADDGINGQLKNCMVKPAAGVKIWFEARLKMNDATQQFFFGLAGVCTTLISSGVLDDTVDKCGFYHEAASTDNKISVVSARTSSEEKDTDVATNTDDTYMKVGLIIDGISRVTYFVNGEPVASCADADDIPNAVMCLSAVAQYESADGIIRADWVKLAQEGGRV